MEKKSPYIDVHTHVNFAAFDRDREEVVKRALENDVFMIQVGTQKDTSYSALSLAKKYEKGVYAAVGIHPIHTGKSFHDEKELGEGGKEFTSRGETFDYNYYKNLAMDPKVVAIGECGLDYYRLDEDSIKKQKENFSKQIALANELQKPLMLHIRSSQKMESSSHGQGAYFDALEMLKSEAKVRGNVHFFAGTLSEAKRFLDIGFALSFTGVITFAKEYEELVRFLPLDAILSETDSPYVAPMPWRGKRNEPIYVKEVVKKIAEIRGESILMVREAIFKNAKKLFSF